MTLQKNIFFYWDNLNIPKDAIDNVNTYKKNNPDYNVFILNDNDINTYKEEFSELIELFHLVTIPALKSDIIRLIFLYKKGGIWIDINTTLIIPNAIDILFRIYKNFDFVITIVPSRENNLKSSAMISTQNSKLALDTIIKITINLKQHYEIEKQNIDYVPYNFFMFVAPVVFYNLLNYKPCNKLKKIVPDFIKDSDNNIITLNNPKFKEYNCGVMDISKYLKFYGCNMNHHHNKNFHKHWSVLQKTQKLFKNIN